MGYQTPGNPCWEFSKTVWKYMFTDSKASKNPLKNEFTNKSNN